MTGRLLAFRHPRPPADPREAADWWLARRVLGVQNPREEAAFQQWMSDPANAASYEAAERVYGEAALHAAEPEILQLRAEALRRRPSGRARGRQLGAGLAAAVVVSAGLAGVAAVTFKSEPHQDMAAIQAPLASPTSSKRYETRVGERRRVRLDDGSIVSLNTGSVLQVSYNRKRRDVRLLKGQVLFEVAHKADWPFVVTVADRQVTAVGTAFDIRLEGTTVSVVLVEGKVRVEPLRLKGFDRLMPRLAEETLVAGEGLVAREGVAEVRVTAADVDRVTRWTEGQIVFRDDALSTAIAELNRYSQTRIVENDPRVAALRISGVFNTDQPQNFIDAVTAFYPVDAHRRSPGVVELVWREPA
jgi:transmembrane sensor